MKSSVTTIMGDYYKEILIGSQILVNERRFMEILKYVRHIKEKSCQIANTKASHKQTITYKVHKTLEISKLI